MDGSVVAGSGERLIFSELASQHLTRLYAIARPLVGDQAEDAVQDCLLKAFRAYDRLENPAAAGAWLTAILVNCCRDRARAWARHPPAADIDELEEFTLFGRIADEDPFPYSDSLHLDFLHQFGRDDVHAVLWGLPEIYRVPLVLVHMHGYATKEVATMLDAPLGTILARLHRGRKLFEKRLWEHAEQNGLLKKERP
ncbi:MAG: RNA polymerase sigma factor [Acidimicrobiia bacterium]